MAGRIVGAATEPWGWMSGVADSERSMMGELEAEPGMDASSVPSPVSSWLPDIAV